jgi:integrase
MRVTSEGPNKITRATVDAAWRRRKPQHRLIVRDKDCRGLTLIVNATSMAWSYGYRPRGLDPATGRRWPNRTVTLGNPATHSPDDARHEVNLIKGRVAAGGDPVREKKARVEAERRRQRNTKLGALVEEYAIALPRRPKMRGPGVPSPSYVSEEVVQVRLALEAMQAVDLEAASLTEANLRQMLHVTAQGSIAIKRWGAISRFMGWCQDARYVAVNPCDMVSRTRRPKAPQSRSNYLRLADLGALWRAASSMGEPVWSDIARFLIAMPCRRAEAATLEWSHIDLVGMEWRQPGRLTKNNEPHRLHLHPLALAVLRERQKRTGGSGLVFPSPRSGGVITNFHSLKLSLSHNGVVDGWTWHDFRRSFATALGEAGVSEVIADAVLNHRQSATRGGVMGVYQRSARWPEQVKAMELWGRLLAAAIEGREADANVVPMTARAG